MDARWVAVRSGDDRREKWFTITAAGTGEAGGGPPRVGAAQARMQALLPEEAWQRLLAILPEIARLTAGA